MGFTVCKSYKKCRKRYSQYEKLVKESKQVKKRFKVWKGIINEGILMNWYKEALKMFYIIYFIYSFQKMNNPLLQINAIMNVKVIITIVKVLVTSDFNSDGLPPTLKT